MKKLSFILSLFTLLFLFTGCAKELEDPFPEWREYRIPAYQEGEKTPVRADEKEVLERCGNVLKDIQSRESILLYDQREYEGDGAFGPGSQILLWKNGEDWMEKNLASIWTPARGGIYQDTQFTYLCKDGEYFIGVENGILAPDSYVTLGWWGDDRPASWLLGCDWDAQEISLVSAYAYEFGKSYVLKFATPYEIANESYLPPAFTRDYTVEFYFDREGAFEKAVMKGDYTDPNLTGTPQETVTITDVMSVASTNGREIADHIEAETQNPFTKSVFDVPDRNYLF
ncbi:MAG: hypothetical protein Q4F17_04020 [Eubacteriales bacterium]|nr:hypothetical protein [Eubacteriales bacterium]